jgi:hypothetical protein
LRERERERVDKGGCMVASRLIAGKEKLKKIK